MQILVVAMLVVVGTFAELRDEDVAAMTVKLDARFAACVHPLVDERWAEPS